MTADIRTAAQREAERVRFRHKGHDYSANRHYKLGFSDGAVWAVARVTPTREQIATEIAKHSRAGDEIDGTLYCGCGEGDYRDANHVAEAILLLMTELAEGSE